MKKVLLYTVLGSIFLCGCVSEPTTAGVQAKANWKVWEKKELHFKTGKNTKPADTEKKVAYFLNCVKTFAPYILEEFKAIDRSMGWKAGSAAKLCVLGADLKKTPPPHECTSWLVMPEVSASGQILLHKNRDTSSRYLTAHRMRVPGKYSWIGNSNFGSFGTTSGINEKALAVVMNSGPRSTGESPMGMGTPTIARILLEQCKTAADAVRLLEKIVKAKAYSHGKSGSIWFFADPERAFLVEHDGLFFKAVEVKSGLAIRANAWHFPEMIVHSKNNPAQITGNSRREYAVRDLLVNKVLGKQKKITLPDMFAASRINKIPEAPKCYALCDKATNVGSTFVIDREFPESLSYFVSTFGPPRHGLYIPVPVTLEDLPLCIRSGSWSEKLFQRRKGKKELDMKKVEAIESAMMKNHLAALDTARKILQAGGFSAKKKAEAIMEKSFKVNMALAEKENALL